MEDKQIVELFWQRDENAISETASKYGKYLKRVSYRVLLNDEDAEECVNDTYNDAWNTIPPHRPDNLATFLGKIARRISIDNWRKRNADKRGGGELTLALDELEECVSGKESVEDDVIRRELIERINKFLYSLPKMERRIFICRYWHMESIAELSKRFGYTESKISSILFRIRNKLRTILEKEEYK